ncbi:hypothetical protein [Streptomyces sp. NPDC002851]
MLVIDGPDEPYAWMDCDLCAAKVLGVDAAVMAEAARRSMRREVDRLDAGVVAEWLCELAAERATFSAEERAVAERVAGEPWWEDPEASAAGFRARAEAAMDEAVVLGQWADSFHALVQGAHDEGPGDDGPHDDGPEGGDRGDGGPDGEAPGPVGFGDLEPRREAESNDAVALADERDRAADEVALADERDPRAYGDMVAVFLASAGHAPTKLRVL